MKKLNVFIILLFFTYAAFGAKVVPLPGLVRPASIKIDKDRFFIAEGAAVYIYSLTDFTLKKKFGKRGAGPMEFQTRPGSHLNDVDIQILPDRLMINSVFRISYFKKDGEYINEIKPQSWAWLLTPLGENFVGRRSTGEKNLRYHVLVLIDPELKQAKEIHRELGFFQVNKTLNPVNRRVMTYYSYDNKLFVEEKWQGLIHVFDAEGKKIYTVSHPFKKVKVTEADKKRFIDYYLGDPVIRPQYEATKELVKFSTHFPLIWEHLTADGKIYVLSYERQNEESKFYIFDIKGKFLKTAMMPLTRMNPEKPYPYTINGGKRYQLVDNDDDEWELHITEFK